MRSSTETLIKAMRILAVDIQSDDGVANAAISEAADRLEGLHERNKVIEVEHREFFDKWHACRRELEASQFDQSARIAELEKHIATYKAKIKSLEYQLKQLAQLHSSTVNALADEREQAAAKDKRIADLKTAQGILEQWAISLKQQNKALQAKREPLSDEGIIKCGYKAGFYIDAVENDDTGEWQEGFINEDGEIDNESFIAFARAIEAAHGVTDE